MGESGVVRPISWTDSSDYSMPSGGIGPCPGDGLRTCEGQVGQATRPEETNLDCIVTGPWLAGNQLGLKDQQHVGPVGVLAAVEDLMQLSDRNHQACLLEAFALGGLPRVFTGFDKPGRQAPITGVRLVTPLNQQ